MTIKLDDIAKQIGAKLIGDGALVINGAGTIDDGHIGEIGFLAESRYAKYATDTKLSALLVAEEVDTPAAQLVVKDVKTAWKKVAQCFESSAQSIGIHSNAYIADGVKIGEDVSIAAGAVIEAGVSIGDRCVIGANVVIESGVTVGADGYIAAGARLLRKTVIGERAFIDCGAVIGSRGFGYAHTGSRWEAVAQLGGVRIGDDVDIGANTTIDCGAIRDTVLEDGVKLDNLIQVGHNVHIGAHTIIAGNCVIAGSVRFGKHCVVGGASVFAGHIQICDGAQFTGHSSVSKSITKPGLYCSALTVMPHRQWARFVGKLKLFGKEK
ncbi:UDP-3-O-(3-hydroxymyristoyl)glucosamine N-acyltransferase [Cardiobacteriaceae bacterium TAE3-ERU3]|nr:UDP-3-O-(3-hydroxymyristoyl)glucosamine N-acyltransferase [Cardiobacteriaceae bacterium TAE3-ERU3]